jgi:hypothetical protein
MRRKTHTYEELLRETERVLAASLSKESRLLRIMGFGRGAGTPGSSCTVSAPQCAG